MSAPCRALFSVATPIHVVTSALRGSRRANQLDDRRPRFGGRSATQGPAAALPRPELASKDDPCTSGRTHLSTAVALAAPAAAALAAVLLFAPHAHASEGEMAPGVLEFIIETIENLGPWGPAAFVTTVAVAESIPLFPTQPLSLASGLLFGAQKGSLCMLSGTVLASLLAFSIARGVGRPLAERIIKHEVGSSDGAAPASPLQQKLAEMMEVIERGSFWQQAGAVLLLRMTPVVPFSASNYVLGLSPLPLAPYLAGTATGMAFWSVFYASLGGASRSLLRRGVAPDVLIADLLAKAGSYTRELAGAGLLLGGAALLYVGVGVVRRQMAVGGSSAADGPSDSDVSGGGSAGGGGGAPAEAVQLPAQLGSGATQQVGSELQLAGVHLKDWRHDGQPAGSGSSSLCGGAPKERLAETRFEE